MTKKDIVKQIADKLDLPLASVYQVVQSVFDDITETLVQEGRIELRNFGILQVKERKARTGRNPRTGDAVAVPKKMVVVFKPGLEMEERVRQMNDVPSRKHPVMAE